MPEKLDILKNQLFENIFNRASNGIAVVGLDYKWIKVNQSLLDLLGYSEAELYEMTFKDITHKDDLDSDNFELNQLLERRIDRYQTEKRYFHKNGGIIWVLVSVSMEVDEFDLPHYFVSQILDISKRKEMDWQISAMSNIVKEQNEKLTNFAHIATHDMRTHLGNLTTISEFMEQEIAGINSDPNFAMLKDSLKQFEVTLLNLNQVRQLDFSIEANRKPLNLYTYVTNGIYNVNAIAKIQHCEIINNVNENVNVLATEVFLDSIILNILSNAIKYRSHYRPCLIEISTESPISLTNFFIT